MTDPAKQRMSLAEYKKLLADGHSTKVVRRNSDEEDLQIACFELVLLMQAANPILRWMYHPPNGGARSKATAGRLRAMGVRSGVPDLLNHKPSGPWAGFAAEAKSSTGRLSDDQIGWLVMFRDQGYLVGLFRTIEEFHSYLEVYLRGTDLPPALNIDQHLTRIRLPQQAARQSRTGRPIIKGSRND